MYLVYVLKSIKDGRLYYCLTKNLRRRIEQHNSGSVSSTKARRPFDLVYYEEASTLEDARKKERYFKSGFGRKYVQNKIKALSSIG